jgi:hypothetical protein
MAASVSERQLAIQACYTIPGWCFPRELGAIYDLCHGSTLHVEIGTYCGRSLFAAVKSMAAGRAIAIDPMEFEAKQSLYPTPSEDWPRDVLAATLRALRRHRPDVAVELWQEPAFDAARRHDLSGITSLYIDDDHHYAELLGHLEVWYPRMAAGGVLLGHDYWSCQPGVIEAVEEFFGRGNLAVEIVSQTRLWFHRVPGL